MTCGGKWGPSPEYAVEGPVGGTTDTGMVLTRVTKPKTSVQANMDGATELMAFGARIRELRAGQGLSQDALGQAAGISRPTLSKIERGVEDVGVVRLSRLAQVLGVEVAELFRQSRDSEAE